MTAQAGTRAVGTTIGSTPYGRTAILRDPSVGCCLDPLSRWSQSPGFGACWHGRPERTTVRRNHALHDPLLHGGTGAAPGLPRQVELSRRRAHPAAQQAVRDRRSAEMQGVPEGSLNRLREGARASASSRVHAGLRRQSVLGTPQDAAVGRVLARSAQRWAWRRASVDAPRSRESRNAP